MADKKDAERMKSRREESGQQVNTRSDRHFGSGMGYGRRFGRIVGRSVFALLLAATLVVSDAMPIPGGLPDTVKADNYPSKGTITFYKYTRLTNIKDVVKKDDSYDYFFMAYEYGGSYYAPYTRILYTDNWPVMKVSEILPHFNASGGNFQSRTRIRQRKFNPKEPTYGSNVIGLWTQYNGIGEAGDWNKSGIDASYTHDKIIPSDFTRYLDVRQSGSGENAKFQIIYVYGSNGSPKDHTRLAANDMFIWGSLNYDAMPFLFYKIDSFTYTCINSNYTIGENQVYVADRDLFLRENVKLTVPEGSVLCVKNGPFYVNGEIECYGTILVEDGGIIMPYESESGGSRIVLKEGGAMIIRSGGRVYAGAPKDSLWTKGSNGWLDMYAGSSVINFGLLIAGQCNFKYGQATLENHKGGKMFLGYYVKNEDESHFMNSSRDDSIMHGAISYSYYYGASKSGGGASVTYGKDNNQTVLKIWEGALTCLQNKASGGGETIKKYYYDKDGNCTVDSNYKPY